MGIRIRWRDNNSSEEGHKIYRSTSTIDPNSLPAELASVGADVNYYDDGSVVASTTYYYRVSAVTDSGAVERVSDELVITATEDPEVVSGCSVYFDMTNTDATYVYDETANSNDATIGGGVTILSDDEGSYIKCTTDSTWLQIPSLPVETDPEFSVVAIVEWDGVASEFDQRGIWGYESNCAIEIVGTGATDLRVLLGSIDENFTTPEANETILVGFAYDGSLLKVVSIGPSGENYEEFTGSSGSIFGAALGQYFASSADDDPALRSWSGKFRRYRQYTRALTLTEFRTLYDEVLV
jgi:hypothetical protein